MPADPSPAAAREPLDPDIRAFQRSLAAGYAEHPALDTVPLAQARRIAETVRAPFTRGGPAMAQTLDRRLEVDGRPIRLRIHRPAELPASLPALVYLHGGGWRYFSIDTHDRLMREYAQRAGIAVVGVDYSLAPEAPYPVALRQVAAAVAWVQAEAGSIGIDRERIALGGDSAGANLALAAALLLKSQGHTPPVQALVLNYGTYRRHVASDSHRLFGGPAFSLTSDEMLGFWRDYLGAAHPATEDAPADPLGEPLYASIGILRGLPPSFLAIAECDVLRDDSIEMADRLAAGGVEVRSVVYTGTTHSFLEAMSLAAVSRRALDETADWLRQRLVPGRGEPGIR